MGYNIDTIYLHCEVRMSDKGCGVLIVFFFAFAAVIAWMSNVSQKLEGFVALATQQEQIIEMLEEQATPVQQPAFITQEVVAAMLRASEPNEILISFGAVRNETGNLYLIGMQENGNYVACELEKMHTCGMVYR